MNKPGGEIPGSNPADSSPKCGPVLIVEDEDVFREVLRHVLESAGYEVLIARNGEEGLALILARRPSLIITDLDMPVLGGTEFIRALHAQAGARIPVILMSSAEFLGEAEPAIAAECEAIVSKPVEPGILLEHVQRLLP